MIELYERFTGWTWIGNRHYWLPIVWSLLSLVGSCRPAFAQVDPITTVGPVLLEQIKKADHTGIIYLFVLVIVLGGVGFFVLLRYVLTHASAIHSEANKTLREIQIDNNKTLLDIMGKHEARVTTLTMTFSSECAELRGVILRIMSDARDMVHATRDIAQGAVSDKEFIDKYRKKEDDVKARRDREQPLSNT